MTEQAIKYFFMASISVINEGKLVTRFNTISSLNSLNITAIVLDMIQQGAASMVSERGGVEFTDLVVENVFCLTPLGCTEDEFTKGTQLADQLRGEVAADAVDEAQGLMAEADASAQAEEALSAQVGEAVDAARNSVQDAANEAVAADHAAAAGTSATAIDQTSDLSNLDAQAIESSPVDDVTTADVKPQD